ncbi:MAG: hypothetical protein AB1642_12890 [Pseudomonadota bacterium]
MLRELHNVQQVPGEPCRRWFFGHDLDLVVWEGEDGTIVGFQLAYDRHHDEHSISWHRERGFAHYAVDDGEPRAGLKQTPILLADGPFQHDRVLDQFLARAAGLPAHVVACVAEKLRAFGKA